MRSSAMLHLNTVQYIFLLELEVKSYCDGYRVAAEEKKKNDLLYRPGCNLHDDAFTSCHHSKRHQQSGVCWWLQNQQRCFNIYIDFKKVCLLYRKQLKTSIRCTVQICYICYIEANVWPHRSVRRHKVCAASWRKHPWVMNGLATSTKGGFGSKA